MKKYKRLSNERPVIRYHGVFKKQLTMFEAVALIVSGTIGAGVLGIPYAVSRVGLTLGLLYVIGIGLMMLGFNLLVGEIATRTKQNMQLAGLARKYLGNVGGWLMTIIISIMITGALLAYIIGEGQTLSILLGGSPFWWSLVFFVFASVIIFLGMSTVKKAELLLSLIIFVVVILIAGISVPHVSWPHFQYYNLAFILFPYGILMFAYHSANVIPEAHSILKNRDQNFRKAIVISSVVTIAVYALFAFIIVGVTGIETTEIATIGLGNSIGKVGFVLGNIFAALAMGTSFLVMGLSFRDSLSWDYKVPRGWSTLIVCGTPFLLFLLGLRRFITVIDLVGGVLISLEILLIVFIYWRAKQEGDLKRGKFRVHHAAFLIAVLIVALMIGAVYSVVKLF